MKADSAGRRQPTRGPSWRTARTCGARAELGGWTASRAHVALTGRVPAARIFSRGRVNNRPPKAIPQVSANWPTQPRQRPTPEPDFSGSDRSAASAGRAHTHATFQRSNCRPARASPCGPDRLPADDQPATRAGSRSARRPHHHVAGLHGPRTRKATRGLRQGASPSVARRATLTTPHDNPRDHRAASPEPDHETPGRPTSPVHSR
jgi:hypothetical protein